jgi:molybdate transport system substrate-binding protein
MFKRTLFLLVLLAIAGPATAATLSAFVTQAIEVALVRLAADFKAQTGHEVSFRFDTSPAIGRRVGAGETGDVIVASASVVDQATREGRVIASTRLEIGRVALGVATRRGAPQPDISSVDALKTALRRADTVLYSQGTSGLYIEKMLATVGLDVALKGTAVQTSSAAVALDRLANSTGDVIAFASISEIRANEAKGVTFVGPLPPAVQNYTTYAAAVLTTSTSSEAARDFVRFITTPAAKGVMTSTGWEPVPATPGRN